MAEISWEVDDGFVTGSRPQSTRISDEELREELADCETEAEKDELINDYIMNDFWNHVSICKAKVRFDDE